MPPSPGKIHSLPVKVLYSIDTSPQTYLTILNDRQDVYVHPSTLAYGLEENQGPLGSCSLKAIARGICYASPECVPNQKTLDFSVYNLDPSLRSGRIARAFPSSNPNSSSETETSWTGKGFLSWILDESGSGNTLIKGRLVREYEFSPMNFNGQGGLEGLMAAVSASASASRIGHREDTDGKGWGLEVAVTLRQLSPEGKIEFAGREAFQEMLVKGRSTDNAVASSSASSRPQTSSSSSISAPRLSVSSAPVPPPGPIVRPQPQHQSSSFTSQSSRIPSSDPIRPPSYPAARSIPVPNPPRPMPVNKPSSQPSSSAMTASSSASHNTARQPERKSSIATALIPPLTVKPESQVARRTTPPPKTKTGKTPPPPSPSHAALTALLRQEGKLSPEVVRQLCSNPALLRLFKAVPASAGPLSALRQGIASSSSTTSTPTLVDPSSVGSTSSISSNGVAEISKPSPAGMDTPTPSNTTPVKSGGPLEPSTNLCYNCGTTESDCWRTKRLKDGTQGKVCNACGLYFNKHKKMRPKELWGKPSTEDVKPVTKSEPQPASAPPNPAVGIRSSPRRNRNTTHDAPVDADLSPRKRQKTGNTPKQPLPSPRMATRASARSDHSGGSGSGEAGLTNNGSQWSSTFNGNGSGQASVNGHDQANGTGNGNTNRHSNGNLQVGDFNDSFGFSPSSLFGTSPVTGANSNTVNDMLHGNSEIDIDQLLAQFASNDSHQAVDGSTIDLDALLSLGGTGGDGIGMDTEGGFLSQDLMDLLAGFESHQTQNENHGGEDGGGLQEQGKEMV